MYLIPRKKTRTIQPQQALRINWSHPALSADAVVWCNGVAYREQRSYRPAPVTRYRAATEIGVATGGGGGRVVVCPFPQTIPKTIIFVGSGYMFSADSSDLNYRGICSASSTALSLGNNSTASSTARRTATITGHNVNAATVYQPTTYTATDWVVHNGGQRFTPTFSGTGGTYYPATNLTVGWSSAAGAAADTHAVLLIVSTAVISTELARSLSENPWQIFEEEDDYLFIPITAGGGPTSITGTASITLADISTNFQLALNHTGQLAVSLSDITFTSSATLKHTGTFTISLDDVTVTAN